MIIVITTAVSIWKKRQPEDHLILAWKETVIKVQN